MINSFLDWAQEQPNVWIVSTAQLLAWVRNPKSIADLNSSDALKCPTPQVDSSLMICNGIPQNENGLLSHCPFPDFPFFTCVCVISTFCLVGGLTDLCIVRMPGRGTDGKQPKPSSVCSRWGAGSIQVYVCFSPFSGHQVIATSCAVPENCTTAFWDPIGGNCLCKDSSCQFNDGSRPIGVCDYLTVSFDLAQVPLLFAAQRG